MWQSIIKPALGLAQTVIQGRQQIKQAEISAKERALMAEDAWDIAAMQASATSWKDELWTVVFVGIVVACFIPPLQPYVEVGFAMLEETPLWFQAAIGVSVSASFGVKAYSKFTQRRLAVKPGTVEQ